MKINKTTLHNIIELLPNHDKLNFEKDFSNNTFDFYLTALGFEERALCIPNSLTKVSKFKVVDSIYFKYSINIESNSFNEPVLLNSLGKFSNYTSSLEVESDNFINNLYDKINNKITDQNVPRILFDISVCSSKLILSVMKVLFQLNVELTIVYTEAKIYHPTLEEFSANPKLYTENKKLGLMKGVEKVLISEGYQGSAREKADLIITFPTFKLERTMAIISYIDETIGKNIHNERLIWIIGIPHMKEPIKSQRKALQKRINKITNSDKCYEVCTLDYKKTIEILEQIFIEKIKNYHINISDLGSKMQTIGISVFCHFRPEVSVYYALPKEHNPSHYSNGCKEFWKINFGETKKILEELNKIDIINIE